MEASAASLRGMRMNSRLTSHHRPSSLTPLTVRTNTALPFSSGPRQSAWPIGMWLSRAGSTPMLPGTSRHFIRPTGP